MWCYKETEETCGVHELKTQFSYCVIHSGEEKNQMLVRINNQWEINGEVCQCIDYNRRCYSAVCWVNRKSDVVSFSDVWLVIIRKVTFGQGSARQCVIVVGRMKTLLHVLVQLMLVWCTASMELLSKTMNRDGIVWTFISAWDRLLFGGEVCGRMEETLFCWYLDSWLDLLNCYVGDVDWWRRSCGLIAGCFI